MASSPEEPFFVDGLASLPPELLEKIAAKAGLFAVQNLFLCGDNLLNVKLCHPSRHLVLSGVTAYDMPEPWFGPMIARFRGLRELTLYSAAADRCYLTRSLLSTLPSSITSLTIVGPTSLECWSEAKIEPGGESERPKWLYVRPKDKFPHLRRLILSGSTLKNSGPAMAGILDFFPSTLTCLKVDVTEFYSRSNYMQRLLKLPTTLKELSLPLRASMVANWVSRLTALETLELPLLDEWQIDSVAQEPCTSITSLSCTSLKNLTASEEISSNWTSIPSPLRLFPNLTSLKSTLLLPTDLVHLENLKTVSLHGKWPFQKIGTFASPSALFPHSLTSLDLSAIDVVPKLGEWVELLPNGLEVLKLPIPLKFETARDWLAFALLPRSLEVLYYGLSAMKISLAEAANLLPPNLREFGCYPFYSDLTDPNELPRGLANMLHMFPKLLTYSAVYKTPNTGRYDGISVQLFRFPDAPLYLGLDQEPNGWINCLAACRMSRIDLLDRLLSSPQLRSFQYPRSGYDADLAPLVQDTPIEVLEWMLDNHFTFHIQAHPLDDNLHWLMSHAIVCGRFDLLQSLEDRGYSVEEMPGALMTAMIGKLSVANLEELFEFGCDLHSSPHQLPGPISLSPIFRTLPRSVLGAAILAQEANSIVWLLSKNEPLLLDLGDLIPLVVQESKYELLQSALHVVNANPDEPIPLWYKGNPISPESWRSIFSEFFKNRKWTGQHLYDTLHLLSQLGLSKEHLNPKKREVGLYSSSGTTFYSPAQLLCDIKWEREASQLSERPNTRASKKAHSTSVGIEMARWMIEEDIPFTLASNAPSPFEHYLLQKQSLHHMDLILYLLEQGKFDDSSKNNRGQDVLEASRTYSRNQPLADAIARIRIASQSTSPSTSPETTPPNDQAEPSAGSSKPPKR